MNEVPASITNKHMYKRACRRHQPKFPQIPPNKSSPEISRATNICMLLSVFCGIYQNANLCTPITRVTINVTQMPMLKIDAAAIALHGLSREGSWAARLVAWVHGAGSRRTDLAAQAAGALWPVRVVWAWPLAGSHAWAHRAVLTVCCSGARGHGSIGVAGFNGPGRQAGPGYNTLL